MDDTSNPWKTSWHPEGAFFSRGTDRSINGVTDRGRNNLADAAGAGLQALGQRKQLQGQSPVAAGMMGMTQGFKNANQIDMENRLRQLMPQQPQGPSLWDRMLGGGSRPQPPVQPAPATTGAYVGGPTGAVGAPQTAFVPGTAIGSLPPGVMPPTPQPSPPGMEAGRPAGGAYDAMPRRPMGWDE